MKKVKNIIIEYSVSFKSVGDIKVWLAEPLNSNLQKVRSFSVKPKPIKSYNDCQGNKVLYFKFVNNKQNYLHMIVELKLWQYQIGLEKLKIDKSKDVSRYLKNENFLEQTKDIKKIAKSILKDSKSELDRIKAAFIFTVDNFNYKYPVVKRGVRNFNFNKLQGDCGEYSSFFVAVCRAMEIPARNVSGYVIYPGANKVMEHGWASIHTKSHGWLDFDTQYAALEKNKVNGLKKYFAARSDYRIAFINGFNIPIRPKIPKECMLEYWNKQGLPLTHSTVQILQPLIYVSDSKVDFREKFFIK